jgi:hypothetical protein
VKWIATSLGLKKRLSKPDRDLLGWAKAADRPDLLGHWPGHFIWHIWNMNFILAKIWHMELLFLQKKNEEVGAECRTASISL